jgi:5-methylthioadenosine/S-adenosylhomocysteine deaminase
VKVSRVLFRDVAVITLDAEGRVLPQTDVAVDGDRILAVGNVPLGFEPDEVVDGRDCLLMPGFFNAHTHAAMTLVRGWADDLPLDRWFNERIWVAESALEEEDVYWGAALAAAEMIRGGTVGFADHYFYMDRVAEVVAESGLRATLAWCVFGLGPGTEIGTDLEGSIAFALRWQGAAEGRIRTVLGPHAPYTCPPDFLKRVAQAAQRHGLGIHIHLAESEAQVADSLARHGATPVAFLDRIGLFDVPAIAAHCIYLDEGDLDILQRKGVHVVQCPNCHMKLGMGVTPVPEMLARGIHVALGTDGAASNNDLDMLEEARLAALLQKNHHRDPEVLPGELALRLATQAGARALGFPESGAVAPGMAADLILLDLNKPHLRPRHDLVANVLYAAKSSDVTHVMVAGRWLLRKGELTTLDEERILYEAERRAWRMVGGELRMVRSYRVGGTSAPHQD